MTEAPDLDALEARTRTLIASDRVTAPTRRALQARLDQAFGAPSVMSDRQMRTLEAACLRIIPEPDLVVRTQLAQAFEGRLAQGLAKGWRYADAPADLELHRAGLDALDAAAGSPFPALDPAEQDALLTRAANGELEGARPLEHWFEELASVLVETFYAHPLVQVAIGYDGMADARGVRAVSLDAVAKEAAHAG